MRPARENATAREVVITLLSLAMFAVIIIFRVVPKEGNWGYLMFLPYPIILWEYCLAIKRIVRNNKS